MRVALVYPEVADLARFREQRKEFPPFGVLYLGSVLEEAHHEVTILKIAPGRTVLDLRSFDAIGFSMPSSATYGVVRAARFESQYADRPLIMVGGVHASFYPERTLRDLGADVLCIGEGEQTILELLDAACSRDFRPVKGICFLDNGKYVETAKRPLLPDINVLPLPARHLLDREDIVMDDRLSNTDVVMAHIMLSRGCPFPCTFCAAAQTKMQYRSGTSARHELTQLIDRYGIGGFAIVDDNFIVNRRRVLEICDGIADLNLQWSALSRVDTVDEALLAALRRAGCIEIKFGIESGSERLLKAMRKNITRDDIRLAVRAARSAGINVKAFLIHGYPGEDEVSTTETITLLDELANSIERVSLFRFVPLPGTYVYNHAAEFDVHGTDQDPAWDGRWEKYHIHHNTEHWWGTAEQFAVTTSSYERLRAFVEARWPDRHSAQAAA